MAEFAENLEAFTINSISRYKPHKTAVVSARKKVAKSRKVNLLAIGFAYDSVCCVWHNAPTPRSDDPNISSKGFFLLILPCFYSNNKLVGFHSTPVNMEFCSWWQSWLGVMRWPNPNE